MIAPEYPAATLTVIVNESDEFALTTFATHETVPVVPS